MTTFLNLSAAQSKGLDIAIYENAQDLYKNAALITQHNKSYSSATSLMVLSLEEVIKAILLKLHCEGLKVYKIDGVQKFIKDHKIRHQIAQIIVTGSGLVEVYKKWLDLKKEPPKFKKNWANNLLDSLKAGMQFYQSALRIEKLKEFDDLKNKGLYVNYFDTIQKPNLMVLEKDYNEVKAIVDRVSNFYRIIKIIYEPQSKYSDFNKRNEYFKIHLKTFVDEVLNEVSIKELSNKNLKQSKIN